jgi:hypothetical protein
MTCENCAKAEATVARLTGERDAHEQFLLNHPCGCLDGLTRGEIRLIARFHDRSDNLEEDLAQAQQALRGLKVAAERIMEYRSHLSGCEFQQTDFCTCGRKQAVNQVKQAIAEAEAASDTPGAQAQEKK